MGLRDDIRALYRENPTISGKEILVRLGCKDNRTFWRVLNEEQVKKRGLYPAKRRNTNAHNKVPYRGITRFVPPKKEQ